MENLNTGLVLDDLDQLLADRRELYIQQKKEWAEIIVDFETRNKYRILDSQQNGLGWVTERAGGLLQTIIRLIARSHRPLEIDVINNASRSILHFSRPFFWFFSDLDLRDPNGQKLGSVHRRFGILYKKYDLKDEHGIIFATVKSPLWRLWRFPVFDRTGMETASINKKWGGALREIFTDADTYQVDFGNQEWTQNQKSVIFAAAVSIDFDFFEENSRSIVD